MGRTPGRGREEVKGKRATGTLLAADGGKRLRNWRLLSSYRVDIELGFGREKS